LDLFWPIKHCLGVYFIIELKLVNYYFTPTSLLPKRGPLGLVKVDYIMFFLLQTLVASWRINVRFFSFVCGKTIFICRNKDRTLTYRRLISFMSSFAYLGFLDTSLSLGLSIFLIPLVLRYMVTSGSRFYQTWFLIFRVFIYFIGGCLTM